VRGSIIKRWGLPPVDRGDEAAEKIAQPDADQQGDERLTAHDTRERLGLFLGHPDAGSGCVARLAAGVARQSSTPLAESVDLLAKGADLVLIRSVFPGHTLATFDEARGCWTDAGSLPADRRAAHQVGEGIGSCAEGRPIWRLVAFRTGRCEQEAPARPCAARA